MPCPSICIIPGHTHVYTYICISNFQISSENSRRQSRRRPTSTSCEFSAHIAIEDVIAIVIGTSDVLEVHSRQAPQAALCHLGNGCWSAGLRIPCLPDIQVHYLVEHSSAERAQKKAPNKCPGSARGVPEKCQRSAQEV